MSVRTAVLIHGYTLTALDKFAAGSTDRVRMWRHVVWGDPKNQEMGRVPFGVAVALRFGAELIILGTGASLLLDEAPITRSEWRKRGSPGHGIWEAEYTKDYLLKNVERLIEFREYQSIFGSAGGMGTIESDLKKLILTDNSSSNTSEEMNQAIQVCKKRNIDRLISITNPSHAPRCMKMISQKIRELCVTDSLTVLATSCQTDFSVGDQTVIFEPQSGPGSKSDLNECSVFQDYFSKLPKIREICMLSVREILATEEDTDFKSEIRK